MKGFDTVASTMPLIKQIAERDLLPFALIGIKMDESENLIDCWFANHDDDLNYFMYEVCKNFVNDYEKNNPDQIISAPTGDKSYEG